MRLFSALTLPPSWHRLLAEVQALLQAKYPQGIRWSPVENLHLTVRFIGEVDDSRARELIATWSSLRLPPELPVLELTTCGTFPDEGPERIVWAGAQAQRGAWLPLVQYIDSVLSNFAIEPVIADPVLHITLGRIRNPALVRGLRESVSGIRLSDVALGVDSVGLFSSVPSSAGSAYTLVATMR